MVAKAIARIGDTVEGICTAHAHSRAWTGTIATGSSNTCEGSGIARVDDTGDTDCGHHFKITSGSSVLSCDGKPVARVDDDVIVIEGGSGSITTGAANATSE